MFTIVADVKAALNVIDKSVGEAMKALMGVAPATFVVYCGTPLSETGWLKVMLNVEPVLVAAVIEIGAVGWGRLACEFFRRLIVCWRLRESALVMGVLLRR